VAGPCTEGGDTDLTDTDAAPGAPIHPQQVYPLHHHTNIGQMGHDTGQHMGHGVGSMGMGVGTASPVSGGHILAGDAAAGAESMEESAGAAEVGRC